MRIVLHCPRKTRTDYSPLQAALEAGWNGAGDGGGKALGGTNFGEARLNVRGAESWGAGDPGLKSRGKQFIG